MKTFRFCQKLRFLARISNWSKISLFVQNFELVQNFAFCAKFRIGPKFRFLSKISNWSKISLFVQNLDFRPQFFDISWSWRLSPDLDSAFNLTVTYRRNSDIGRPFSDIEWIIQRMRFHHVDGHLLQSDENYQKNLIEYKHPYGSKFNTGWIISNCNDTLTANVRWEYGAKLIKAGLKVNGTGKCFGNQTRKKSSDWATRSKLKVIVHNFILKKIWLNFSNNKNGLILYFWGWRNSAAIFHLKFR